MNLFINIILSAVFATTAMTLFSYIAGFIFKENFKEPVLLNRLISQMEFLPPAIRNSKASGWILHYLIGIIFAAVAVLIIYLTHWSFTRMYSIGFGFVAGIAGILGWKAMFKIYTHPSRTDVKAYFIQLLAAHILFGWSLTVFFTLFSPDISL